MKTEEKQSETQDFSTLRIVAKREEDKEPYKVRIPVKEDKFSLVLPNGYVNWPEGEPYPDPVRVAVDEEKKLVDKLWHFGKPRILRHVGN